MERGEKRAHQVGEYPGDGGVPGAMIEKALTAFQTHLDPRAKAADLTAARAPGRVNLIGEHTDYHDGFVFPAAIDREIAVVGRVRNDRMVRLYSVDYGQLSEFPLSELIPSSADGTAFGTVTDAATRAASETAKGAASGAANGAGDVERAVEAAVQPAVQPTVEPARWSQARSAEAPWSNYIRGVIAVLHLEGYTLGGFEVAVAGNVPKGAGLSSSAALEVATIALLDALYGLGIDPVKRALLGQRAENEFVGVACGIMDQFVSSTAQEDHGLLLDCRTLAHEHIPLRLAETSIVVVNTNKRRGLVDSEYNARRRESEEGARVLARRIPGVKALRDVSPAQFAAHEEALAPMVRRRSRHVVHECARVLAGVAALTSGDLNRFGLLMNESHESLRDLYEVSCMELDVVVEIAQQTPGVLGARMTGAGFGGCAVMLVNDNAVPRLTEALYDQYPKRTGLTPEVFTFRASNGAEVIPRL